MVTRAGESAGSGESEVQQLYIFTLMTNTSERILQGKMLHSVIVMLGAAFQLWPALYNGYPMMNADAGTYLASGFTLETPFDRPIVYGLLIRLLSFNGWSLWPLVYIQGLLIMALVTGIIKQLVPGVKYLRYVFLTSLLLATGTGLPWLVSQAQPDVFTPIALLCIARIIMGTQSKAASVCLYLLYFVAVSVHMSHPLLMAGTVVCLYLLRRFYSAGGSKAMVGRMIILVVVAACTIVFMGSALSKSKHVFLMGSLVEKGVLKEYLDDRCGTTPFRICAYKNQLPATLNEFIWMPSSPLYKVGDWRGSKPEFNAIIHDILTTPKYFSHFITASVHATGSQLVTFGMGDGNTVFPPGSVLSDRVATYIPTEGRQFQGSKQNQDKLLHVFAVPDVIAKWIAALSLIVIAILIWHSSANVKLLTLLCIFGILLNAADTATFSCVQDRYGCRVMWLLTLCAAAAISSKRRDSGSQAKH